MQIQTIALIDDDRNILTSISIALEKEGFKVQTYIDGESALIGLTRTPPDLAVIDIKMPKMDGEELLKKLRKKFLEHLQDIAKHGMLCPNFSTHILTEPYQKNFLDLLEKHKIYLNLSNYF